jgi:hypothetical protein
MACSQQLFVCLATVSQACWLCPAGKRKVLWHNMREEPVLYINGKPYVVREADQPFCNVEYTGIDRTRVEDMEVRLKRDVLREAQLYDGHVLVTEEDDDMQVGTRLTGVAGTKACFASSRHLHVVVLVVVCVA